MIWKPKGQVRAWEGMVLNKSWDDMRGMVGGPGQARLTGNNNTQVSPETGQQVCRDPRAKGTARSLPCHQVLRTGTGMTRGYVLCQSWAQGTVVVISPLYKLFDVDGSLPTRAIPHGESTRRSPAQEGATRYYEVPTLHLEDTEEYMRARVCVQRGGRRSHTHRIGEWHVMPQNKGIRQGYEVKYNQLTVENQVR